MCRNIDHGGRRCPNDNNAARRLRRANAALKATYADSTTASNSVPKNTSSQVAEPIGLVTVEDVKAHLKQMEFWKKHLWNADGSVTPLTEDQWVIDGVKYDDRFAFRAALLSKVESDTIKLGGLVAAAASAITGHGDETILRLNSEALAAAEDNHKKATAAKDAMFKMLSQKYGVTEMDAPYHVSMKLRVAQIENKFGDANISTAEMEADVAEGRRLYKEYENATSQLRSVKLNGSSEALQMLKENQAAQKQVLREVRSLGGKPVVNEKSNPQKVKTLEAALENYPTEWIEESNKTGDNLIIKKTVARAHYSDASFQQEYKLVKMGGIRTLDREPNNTYHESGWVKLEADEYGEAKYVDEHGNEHITYVEDGKTAYYAPIFEYYSPYSHRMVNGKPKGNGWEQVTVLDMKYDPHTQTRTPEEVTTWRRTKTRRSLVSLSTKAELLIDGGSDGGYDTALHEFMHRVEAKNPKIGDLEAEFVRRRTTLADGSQEKFVTLYKGKKEISRVDNFVDDYMGKHYNDGKHWEVLSTGAEAVFGRSFGNFMGFNQRKTDLEHRDFVLGIFAGI